MDRPFSANLVAFLDHTLDAVFAVDDTRRIVHANAAALKLLAGSRDEVLHRRIDDLVRQPPGATVDEAWAQFLAEAKFRGRLAVTRLDGKRREVEVTATAHWRRGLHVWFCRDVTERALAERRLTTQVEIARALTEASSIADAAPRLLGALAFTLDASAGALWVLDRPADVLRCAGVWAGGTAAGWTPADSPAGALRRGEGIPGLVWQSGRMLHLADLEQAPESPRRRDALRCGLLTACAFPIPGSFGIIGVAEFYGRAIQPPDAEHLEVLTAACSQLSQFFERRRAESQLLITGKLGWYMPVPLAVWRLADATEPPQFRLVATNPAMRRHAGEDWAVGAPMDELIPGIASSDIPRLLANVVETGHPLDIADHPSLVRNGVVVSLRAIPLPDFSVGVMLEDVTERRRLEQQLLSYTTDLEYEVNTRIAQIRQLETERARAEKLAATGRLAARVAHEIINPLASIKSAFALVKEGVAPDFTHAHYVPRIEREIDRIAGIVGQMRELYRPLTEPLTACDVVAVAQDVVALTEPDARLRGVTVRLDAPAGSLPGAVQLGGLSQILHNLLRNALDASPPGGCVDVRVREADGMLRFAVADEGHGVPPDVEEHLFEPFFTTKAGGTGATGLGLGLSIARGLAEAMRGEIVLTRDRPVGAEFTLIIPRAGVQASLDGGSADRYRAMTSG
jgi:PAS domain S-box-containing protein